MWPNLQFPADLITFIEKILKKNFIFLSSVWVKSDKVQSPRQWPEVGQITDKKK